MRPQLYILCVLCVFAVNISFSQETDETKALQTLIENQSVRPALDGMKLIFSAYTNGSDVTKQAIEKSIPRLKMTDEILDWLKSDAAKSPNKDIRMLTLRIISIDSLFDFHLKFSSIFLYDPDKEIRLANIKTLNDSPQWCGNAIEDELIPQLEIALTDGFYPVRKTALEALDKYISHIKSPDAIIKRYPKEPSMTLQFEMENSLISGIHHYDYLNSLTHYLYSDSPEISALLCRVVGKSSNILNETEKNRCAWALNKVKDDNAKVSSSKQWALRQLKGSEPKQSNETKPQGRIAASLLNRFEPLRKKTLLKYNGDEKTEKAVQLGLEWLARNQESDGSWNCARNNPWHNNVVLPSFTNEDELVDVSVSGLALLCFLGDGSTNQYGLYQETVQKGLEFIKSAQDKTGCVNIPKGHVHNKQCLEQGEDHGQLARRYNHNISTLFLVELYAMTSDPGIKDIAQRALEHSRNTPEPGFPWSFYLEPSDMGPSIFYILALRLAQETDLAVSPKEIERVKVYLDQLTDRKSGRIVHICAIPICFGGMDSTASGLFAHILIKNDKEIITKGANWLKQFPPQWEPFYQYTDYYPNLLFLEENVMNEWHWYYQTLAFRQLGRPSPVQRSGYPSPRRSFGTAEDGYGAADGGDYWTEWNQKHKEVLLKHQRIGGLLDGSWDPEGPWATIGGRVYSTAFSILSLQAYYSYEFK
ncbi:MAG: hypothetical protein AB1599_06875 [Planctomycetota bacterium]